MSKRSSCLTVLPVLVLQVGASIPSLKLFANTEASSQMIAFALPHNLSCVVRIRLPSPAHTVMALEIRVCQSVHAYSLTKSALLLILLT